MNNQPHVALGKAKRRKSASKQAIQRTEVAQGGVLGAAPSQGAFAQRTFGNHALGGGTTTLQRAAQDGAREARQPEAAPLVQPGVEQAIEGSRGRGAPLDGGIRRQMESSLGADFSGVCVHTGAQAHQLNRSLDAKAFTTGSDVFFRDGAYNPQHPASQKLIAHELTHVVQQRNAPKVGAGGKSAGGVQRSVIQRNVGFEFEAGTWALETLNSPLTPGQIAGTEEVPKGQVAKNVLNKDSVLHTGKGWKMKADVGQDTHVEFVTDPPGFPEGKEGKKALKKSFADLKEFGDNMLAERGNAKVRVQNSFGLKYAAPQIDANGTIPNVLIKPSNTLDAEPQVTGGIRLEQLATVLEQMDDAQGNDESNKEFRQRQKAMSIMWGKQPRDRKLLAESPQAVRDSVEENLEYYKDDDFEGYPGGIPNPPSAQLLGIISIIRSYLISAAGQIAYAKSLAPLMARTDLGTVFDALPEKDFYRDNPQVFLNLVMDASGMPAQYDRPVFAGTTRYVHPDHWQALQDALSRRDWIYSITQGSGHDLLTEANFPDRDVAELVFGLGGLGNKTDTVGKKHTFSKDTKTGGAPVFEFRRMGQSNPHYAWPSLAVEIFDWLSQINDMKSGVFKGKKTTKAMEGGG